MIIYDISDILLLNGIKTLSIFIDPSPPMILGEDYDLFIAKIGSTVWTDNSDRFTTLPGFLKDAYYFKTSVKGNKGKNWSIKVYGPSAIYIAIHDEVKITIERLEGGEANSNIKSTEGLVDEDDGDPADSETRPDGDTDGPPTQQSGGGSSENGGAATDQNNGASNQENNEENTGHDLNKWRKLRGAVTTSSLTLSTILTKNLHNKGPNTVKLPEIETENFIMSIFITGKYFC